ncbi:MAG: hypothetical protein WD045_03290, partial [Pirellulaceae bacterium]
MKRNGIARFTTALAVVVALVGSSWANISRADSSIKRIDVYPPSIDLTTSRDLQRVIVVATREDDVTFEVTAEATWKLADESLVELAGNTLHPK